MLVIGNANVLQHCIVSIEYLVSKYLGVISKQQYPGRHKPTEISEDPNLISSLSEINLH